MNRHARLFHRIAPIYRLFFGYQARNYRGLLDKHGLRLPGGKVLDIGCGTGAFSHSLYQKGYEVTGVDFAPGMIRQAQDLSPRVNFMVADGAKLAIPDRSFDLVCAAFVAHGLSSENRLVLYREAARLARGQVLFHDYNRRRNLLIDLVEGLEGGNYFSFIQDGVAEMEQVFSRVEIVEVSSWANWYLCSP